METKTFEELYKINITDKVEQKEGLNYLSWAWAWAEVKKVDEKANYEIKMFDGKPYLEDDNLGYMVMTSMTINDITHEMWLPVMNSKNKAMKNTEYQYTTKTGTYSVEKASMFDVNKTLMRCLVKNIAMFGLGLILYTGEDLPEEELTEEMAKNIVLDFGKHKGETLGELVEREDSYINYLFQNGKPRIKEAITLLTGMVDIPNEESIEKINNEMMITEGQKQRIKDLPIEKEQIKKYLTKLNKSKISELTYGEANKLLEEAEGSIRAEIAFYEREVEG